MEKMTVKEVKEKEDLKEEVATSDNIKEEITTPNTAYEDVFSIEEQRVDEAQTDENKEEVQDQTIVKDRGQWIESWRGCWNWCEARSWRY